MKASKVSRIALGLALVVVLALLIAPTLLARTVARGWIASRMEGALNATVSIDRVRLAWRGEQAVEGLALRTTGGEPVANLDVTLRGGLLGLLTGSLERHDVHATGRVEVTRGKDGTMALATLRRDRTPRPGPARPEPARPVTIQIDGLDVHFADATGRSLDVRGLDGHFRLEPGAAVELVLGGTIVVDGAEETLAIEGTATNLVDRAGAITIAGASARVELRCDVAPSKLGLHGGLGAHRLQVTLASDDLSKAARLTVEGEPLAQGASGALAADLRIETPFSDDGALRLSPVQLSGTVTGRDVPSAVVQSLLGGTFLDVDRDLGPRLDFDGAIGAAPERRATFAARGEHAQLEIAATIDPDASLRGERLRLAGRAQPALAAHVGVDVARPFDYVLELGAFGAPRSEHGWFALDRLSAAGALTIPGPVELALGETLTLDDVEVRFETDAVGEAVRGHARLAVDDAPTQIEWTLTGLAAADGRLRPGQSVLAATVGLGALPRALAPLGPDGAAPFSVSDVGSVRVTIGPAPADAGGGDGVPFSVAIDALTLTPRDPALAPFAVHGLDTRGRLAPDAVELRAQPLALTITPAHMESLFAGDREVDATPSPTRPVADLPVTVELRHLRVPIGGPRGSAGPSAIALDLRSAGGPLVLDHAGARMTIENLSLRLSRDGAAPRLEFVLTGRPRLSRPGEEEVVGDPIDLHGAVTDAGGGAGMTLDAKVTADGLPTVLPDAMAGLDGLLVAAIGPWMDAEIRSHGFSRASGRLDGAIRSPRGSVEVHVEAHDGLIVTAPGSPIRAELEATPALAGKCLAYIHPALEDIVSTERPIKIEIAELSIPWRADPSRVNAIIKIDIGEARFRASSDILAPLKIVAGALKAATGGGGSAATPTVQGVVEPIEARIVNGVVTYDRFVITIGKQRLRYTGTIDLGQRTLDIQTEVPIVALGGDIAAQIPVLPTGIVVPIRSSGSFDKIKTEVQLGKLIGNIPGSILEKIFGNGDKSGGR